MEPTPGPGEDIAQPEGFDGFGCTGYGPGSEGLALVAGFFIAGLFGAGGSALGGGGFSLGTHRLAVTQVEPSGHFLPEGQAAVTLEKGYSCPLAPPLPHGLLMPFLMQREISLHCVSLAVQSLWVLHTLCWQVVPQWSVSA